MRLLFLGTGGSLGVPVVGCSCPVCHSLDPKNRRLRSSLWISDEKTSFIIDIGPDFRQQALHYGLPRPSGILLTHAHRDHVAGVDEMRAYQMQNKDPIPCIASTPVLHALQKNYSYLFYDRQDHRLLTGLDFHVLEEDTGEFSFLGHTFSYVSYEQDGMQVTGFRLGNMAYLCDLHRFDDAIFSKLVGVDLLILGAFRFNLKQKTLNVDMGIDFAKKVNAKETLFTHIAHEYPHEKIQSQLPEGMDVAFDGMSRTFTV